MDDGDGAALLALGRGEPLEGSRSIDEGFQLSGEVARQASFHGPAHRCEMSRGGFGGDHIALGVLQAIRVHCEPVKREIVGLCKLARTDPRKKRKASVEPAYVTRSTKRTGSRVFVHGANPADDMVSGVCRK